MLRVYNQICVFVSRTIAPLISVVSLFIVYVVQAIIVFQARFDFKSTAIRIFTKSIFVTKKKKTLTKNANNFDRRNFRSLFGFAARELLFRQKRIVKIQCKRFPNELST